MDNTIQALFDREEIRNLRTLYAHHLDSNNIAALDQVFSADAVVEVTVGKMEGLAAIRSGLSEAFKLFDRDHHGSYPFLHAIVNRRSLLSDRFRNGIQAGPQSFAASWTLCRRVPAHRWPMAHYAHLPGSCVATAQ
jgi:hypothetical protein